MESSEVEQNLVTEKQKNDNDWLTNFSLVWINFNLFKWYPDLPGVNELTHWYTNIDGLVQDSSNSIADALELLQSYTKPSIYITCKSCKTAVIPLLMH